MCHSPDVKEYTSELEPVPVFKIVKVPYNCTIAVNNNRSFDDLPELLNRREKYRNEHDYDRK
ncbi:MAG: hypothetical protein ABJC87_07290, partial [Roseobacter sp.]